MVAQKGSTMIVSRNCDEIISLRYLTVSVLMLACLVLAVGQFLGNVAHAAEPVQEDTVAHKVVEGKLGQSLVQVVVPKQWNHNLILIAHGYRPAEQPLSAKFSTDNVFVKTFVDEGWMIASTSYRRNGYLIDEAIEDIEFLRQDITEHYGEPRRVFLVGSSMGGAIVIRMAETLSGKYSGALAIGTIFHKPTYKPEIPLLMISNQNEISGPRDYAKKSEGRTLKSACWVVTRDGHCNVTSAERLEALQSLVRWTEGVPIQLSRDATIASVIPPSVAIFKDDNTSAHAKITTLHGKFETEFTADDLKRLGIVLNADFSVSCKGRQVVAKYGITYSSVPKGEWVAFVYADNGRVVLARNFRDATQDMDWCVGDELTIAPVNAVIENKGNTR